MEPSTPSYSSSDVLDPNQRTKRLKTSHGTSVSCQPSKGTVIAPAGTFLATMANEGCRFDAFLALLSSFFHLNYQTGDQLPYWIVNSDEDFIHGMEELRCVVYYRPCDIINVDGTMPEKIEASKDEGRIYCDTSDPASVIPITVMSILCRVCYSP
jgi:hypothetical protein